ncbi:MAG: efflux RND transporter periplasmic adaptor subunit [Candidatus Tectomicrobia bacterium]|nr:efflux RND transporter periplasmic adaptor subunit [Candidatus Tectomicrobia bacterium]
MKRLLLLIAIACAAAAAGFYLYARGPSKAPQYRLAKAERGPLIATVSASGTLNAVVTVQVGSQVSGQIKQILVDFNSAVKQAQIIARIDPEIFEAKVNQAVADLAAARAAVLNQEAQVERSRANVETARAALAGAKAGIAKARVGLLDAERNLRRRRDLFAQALIPESEMDTAQAGRDAALAQLEAARAEEQARAAGVRSDEAQLRVNLAQLNTSKAQAQQKEAALRQAEVDLEHTIIRAPVDGVVISRNVDVGQTVAASLQAPTLFTIAQDLTRMQVNTSVDEADIGRIRIGQNAAFSVDSFPGRTFTGQVVQVRKAPQVVQNVVTYDVVVSARNPDLILLPGMTANVRLFVDRKENALKIPNAALRFRPPGAPTVVPARSGPPAPGPGPAVGRRVNRAGTPPPASRERLAKELSLTQEQQAKLDAVLRENRQKLGALGDGGSPDGDRAAQIQKVQEATQTRIREILTPEQIARYNQILAASPEREEGLRGQVWVIGEWGKPKSLSVRLGISDGTFTEVLDGPLAEGQEVIMGAPVSGRAAPSAPSSRTPRFRM